MKIRKFIVAMGFVVSGFAVAVAPAAAQFAGGQSSSVQQIAVDNFGQAICSGPLGPGRCADIAAWMQRGGTQGRGNGPFGPAGAMGVPTNIVPRDGQIVAQIAQSCNGEPRCMAAAWASVEVQRCNNGFGVSGGCFGPNGEIMKVINRFVPQNLQPNVIIHNMANDIQNGPGENNDLVGKKGFVCQTFFGGC